MTLGVDEKRPTAAVGIICKTPQAGGSKTRMAPVLGLSGAAELATCFFKDVAAAINGVPEDLGRRGYAVYSPAGSEDALRKLIPADFGLLCRKDANLGVVLEGATAELLALGHDCAILVNGDSPTLPSEAIAQTISALRRPGERIVLGPALDGGYYLIGMTRVHSAVFHDIPWSTPDVLTATLRQAGQAGIAVERLPMWYDIDELESLKILIDEFKGLPPPFDTGGWTGSPAPCTRAFLSARPELTARSLSPTARAG